MCRLSTFDYVTFDYVTLGVTRLRLVTPWVYPIHNSFLGVYLSRIQVYTAFRTTLKLEFKNTHGTYRKLFVYPPVSAPEQLYLSYQIPNPNPSEVAAGRKSVYDTWLKRTPQKTADGRTLNVPKYV